MKHRTLLEELKRLAFKKAQRKEKAKAAYQKRKAEKRKNEDPTIFKHTTYDRFYIHSDRKRR